MPTYEYECQQCGHRFEEFQSITAEPRQTCPEANCQGSVKRLIGMGGGLLFKGSGFYITDYRSDGYQKAAKADKDSGNGKKADKDSGSGKKADKDSGSGKKGDKKGDGKANAAKAD